MHIGNNICKLRKSLHMSQEEFGRLIGLSKSAVSRIENKASIDTEILVKICAYFNVSTSLLLEEVPAWEVANPMAVHYPIRNLEDLYIGTLSDFSNLPSAQKNFAKALGLEISKQIQKYEESAVSSFAKCLELRLMEILTDIGESNFDKCKSIICNSMEEWAKHNTSTFREE